MKIRNRFASSPTTPLAVKKLSKLAIASVVATSSLSIPMTHPTWAEETKSNDSPTNMTSNDHAPDESPSLGVIVGSCPGQGVCVLDTVWASPADQAGIAHGDYILSVNDTDVSTPKELIQAMKKVKGNKKVKLSVWREGETIERDVTLASKADKQPASQKTYLGVMLSPNMSGDRQGMGSDEASDNKHEGVLVQRVMRDSPAADAGLRSGDRIVERDGEKIKDLQAFLRSVEDMGPDAKMKLMVVRDGNEKQIDVTLGNVEEAPIRIMRQMTQMMRQDMEGSNSEGSSSNESGSEMMDDAIDEMRSRIRELEKKVEEMTSNNDVSMLLEEPSSGDATTLVAQFGRFNRDWDDRFGRNRLFNDGRDDWRNRYRSGYRSQLYRSPGLGNSYYNYGGRPYYGNFGSRSGYGFGRNNGGVRIGNFGVWW